jgi:hypothetical protein
MGVREEVHCPARVKETFLFARARLSGLDWLLEEGSLHACMDAASSLAHVTAPR